MEKVKLTQEQADAIENLLSLDVVTVKQIIKYNVNGIKEIDKCTYAETISKMDLDALIKALYIGYEVEPEFYLNEFVKFHSLGFDREMVGRITSINNDTRSLTVDTIDIIIPYEKAQYATREEYEQEKERMWWGEHGRKIREIKEGDIVEIYHHVEEVKEVKYAGRVIYITNFIQAFGPEEINIVCLAEDRKDVKE